MLCLDQSEPGGDVRARSLWDESLGPGKEVRCVGGPGLGFLATGGELPQGVLAHRLQHHVPRFSTQALDLTEQALVHQRGDAVNDVSARVLASDRLRRC